MLLGCSQGAKGHVFRTFSDCESSFNSVWRSCMLRNRRPDSSRAVCSVLPPRFALVAVIFPVFASMAVTRLAPRSAVKTLCVFLSKRMAFGVRAHGHFVDDR